MIATMDAPEVVAAVAGGVAAAALLCWSVVTVAARLARRRPGTGAGDPGGR
jgi:hypothetical protein